MDIAIKDADDVKVLAFEGNLDTSTAPEAESTINGLLDEGAAKILINFENLNYISSAGLRVLLATAKKIKAASGGFKICGLNETVQEVFDVSGFSTILSVAANEEAALSGF
jgi:anti-sigma B factor antagonist